MELKRLQLSYIRSFRSLDFDLSKTNVLIGQNDHGKSSILKVLDLILNQITPEMINNQILQPDVAEKLLTIFSTNAKARRITLVYSINEKDKLIHLTLRTDYSFIIHEKIARGAKHNHRAAQSFLELRKHTKFILIPAVRDASSIIFSRLFENTLQSHGLEQIIPTTAGGTTREYRKLKKITNDIKNTIKPYVDNTLMPNLRREFSFNTDNPFELSFNVTVEQISRWIRSNINLGLQLGNPQKNEDATLALIEAGNGIQSAVLLALHKLKIKASKTPDTIFYFAIEEPESYLHPQHQKELYETLRNDSTSNLRYIITTHSPFIVADTDYSSIGIIHKQDRFSSLYTPECSDTREEEMFNSFSTDVNSLMFFADKIILVEGESDQRVLRVLLKKAYGEKHHRISIISAGGNQRFSPYLRMILSWRKFKIPYIIVTDFDSLTKATDRAIFNGLRNAGFTTPQASIIYSEIDSSIDKNYSEHNSAAQRASSYFYDLGVSVFIYSSDLEYSLITTDNKNDVTKIMNEECSTNNDYSSGYTLDQLKKVIGSKGIPVQPNDNAKFKKPYIHEKISRTIDIDNCDKDLESLLQFIDQI